LGFPTILTKPALCCGIFDKRPELAAKLAIIERCEGYPIRTVRKSEVLGSQTFHKGSVCQVVGNPRAFRSTLGYFLSKFSSLGVR
jgi:hypothetical protein